MRRCPGMSHRECRLPQSETVLSALSASPSRRDAEHPRRPRYLSLSPNIVVVRSSCRSWKTASMLLESGSAETRRSSRGGIRAARRGRRWRRSRLDPCSVERVDGFLVGGFEGEVEVLGGLSFDDREGGAGAADLGAALVALDGVRDGRADGLVEATCSVEVEAAEPEVVDDAGWRRGPLLTASTLLPAGR